MDIVYSKIKLKSFSRDKIDTNLSITLFNKSVEVGPKGLLSLDVDFVDLDNISKSIHYSEFHGTHYIISWKNNLSKTFGWQRVKGTLIFLINKGYYDKQRHESFIDYFRQCQLYQEHPYTHTCFISNKRDII